MTLRRKIWIVFLTCTLFTLLALLYITRHFDLAAYRFPLTQTLSLALGRDVRVDGPMYLKLAWTPVLSVRDVRISNPSGMPQGEFLRVDTLDIRVGLRALLNQRLAVRDIRVSGVTLNLRRDERGNNNWTFSNDAPKAAESNLLITEISHVALADTTILWHTGDAAPKMYKIRNVDYQIFRGDQFRLKLDAAMPGLPFTLQTDAWRSGEHWIFSNQVHSDQFHVAGAIDWAQRDGRHKVDAIFSADANFTATRPSDASVTRNNRPGAAPLQIEFPRYAEWPSNIDIDIALNADNIQFGTHRLHQADTRLRYRHGRLSVERLEARYNDQALTASAEIAALDDDIRVNATVKAPSFNLGAAQISGVMGDAVNTELHYSTHGLSLAQWIRRSHAYMGTTVNYAQLGIPRLALFNAKYSARYRPLKGMTASLHGTLLSKRIAVDFTADPLLRSLQFGGDPRMALHVKFGQTQAAAHSTWRDFTGDTRVMQIQLQGNQLSELGELLGAALPRVAKYSVSTTLQITHDELTATQMLIETPSSYLAGGFYYQWPEEMLPVMRLLVSRGALDVEELQKAFAQETRAPVQTANAKATMLIPDTPLASLLELPFALEIEADHIDAISPKLTLQKAELNGRLMPGAIEMKLRIGNLAEGQVEGGFVVARAEHDVAMQTHLTIKDLNYGHAFAQAGVSDKILGTANLVIDVIGRGTTAKSLLRQAQGRIDLNGGKGVILNRYLRLWGDDIVQQLLPGNWLQDEASTLNCAYARLHLQDGVLRTDALVVDTEHITVVGGGGLEIGGEKLEFLLTPQPKNPSLLSLATPVRIRGTMAEPQVATHKMATLWTIGTLAAGVVNPVVLLARFSSLGNLGEDACRQSVGDTAPRQDNIAVKWIKQLNSLVTFFQRPFDQLPDVDLSLDKAVQWIKNPGATPAPETMPESP